MFINCVLLLTFAVVSTFAMGSLKNITVTGQIACSDRSQKGIEVQLWERDTLDPDDLLNTTKTDVRGYFHIYGEENEVNNIEPYLIIVHSCDNGVVNPVRFVRSGQMLYTVLFLLSLVSCPSMLTAICTVSHVTVTGQLGCGDLALKNVIVELREHDTIDPDDSLNKTTSDSKGYFSIYGEECEIGNIEPYLRITHNCEDGILSGNCVITDDFPIASDHIGKTYQMGIVSLNIARMNHKKNCH
uniref:Transthyretin-like family protein n=1 Tax=Elaeophora elaphi TaxID=1147741 RepID=A0A0R3RHW0_9BILA